MRPCAASPTERASNEVVYQSKLRILEITEAARRRNARRTLDEHEAERLRRTLPPDLGGRRPVTHDPDAYRASIARAAWHLHATGSGNPHSRELLRQMWAETS